MPTVSQSLRYLLDAMVEWEISIWLAKNIEKYHAWLWSSQVKILELSQVAPTSDKSNIFTSDDHNHKWYFSIFLPAM